MITIFFSRWCISAAILANRVRFAKWSCVVSWLSCRCHRCTSRDELSSQLRTLLEMYLGQYGVLLLLYSILLTKVGDCLKNYTMSFYYSFLFWIIYSLSEIRIWLFVYEIQWSPYLYLTITEITFLYFITILDLFGSTSCRIHIFYGTASSQSNQQLWLNWDSCWVDR